MNPKRLFLTLPLLVLSLALLQPTAPARSAGNADARRAAQAQTATHTPAPTGLPISPIQTATPNEDGSIIHEVQPGQTLIGIAEAYGVSLPDLLALNNMQANDPIYPGDKLIVRGPNTPTPSPEVTDTPTPRPATPTRRPTRTATDRPPTVTFTPTPRDTATPTPSPMDGLTDPVGKVMVGAIIVLGVAGAGLMVAGSVLKRRK
jgi:LysM repeat protein